MITINTSKNKPIKLNEEENAKILDELENSTKPAVSGEYLDFVKSCLEVTDTINNNFTKKTSFWGAGSW